MGSTPRRCADKCGYREGSAQPHGGDLVARLVQPSPTEDANPPTGFLAKQCTHRTCACVACAVTVSDGGSNEQQSPVEVSHPPVRRTRVKGDF